MSLKNRRFSLDSSVSPDTSGVGLLGVLKGSKIRKKSRAGQSLEEAQLELQRLGRTLDTSSIRPQTIEEEGDQQDGLITKSSFLKHNKTFHKLFQDISEDEDLTHSFTCALQKEVLYLGKLYVSENYICFYSSVLLKDTKLVILASTVRDVKKHRKLLSMLSVHTVHGDKYSFVSLRSREICYKLLQTLCTQAQRGDSPNSSAHVSSADNGGDQDTISCCSSLADSTDVSRDVDVDIGFSPVPSRDASSVPGRHTSSPKSTSQDEDTSVPWIRSLVEKVSSLLLMRGVSNLTVIFYVYLVLVVLLLLTSGYIGLRILALEERLNSLGALNEFSLKEKQYKET